MNIDVNDLAVALLTYAKNRVIDLLEITSVTMEVSLVSGAPGFICRIMHHTVDYPKIILVPLTDYYSSGTKHKFILERLPLEDVIKEYDRLFDTAMSYGLFGYDEEKSP